MVKGIEKYGIPVVHMATVVPISLTIGANRIIPGIGIPYPLGDPPQGEKDLSLIHILHRHYHQPGEYHRGYRRRSTEKSRRVR